MIDYQRKLWAAFFAESWDVIAVNCLPFNVNEIRTLNAAAISNAAMQYLDSMMLEVENDLKVQGKSWDKLFIKPLQHSAKPIVISKQINLIALLKHLYGSPLSSKNHFKKVHFQNMIRQLILRICIYFSFTMNYSMSLRKQKIAIKDLSF